MSRIPIIARQGIALFAARYSSECFFGKLSDLKDRHRYRVSVDKPLRFIEKQPPVITEEAVSLANLFAIGDHFSQNQTVFTVHRSESHPFWPAESAPCRRRYPLPDRQGHAVLPPNPATAPRV